MEEPIEWIKRCPHATGVGVDIEIRQVSEAEEFGPEFTPELREREDRQRADGREALVVGRDRSGGGSERTRKES
jgi:hypothetical protein